MFGGELLEKFNNDNNGFATAWAISRNDSQTDYLE